MDMPAPSASYTPTTCCQTPFGPTSAVASDVAVADSTWNRYLPPVTSSEYCIPRTPPPPLGPLPLETMPPPSRGWLTEALTQASIEKLVAPPEKSSPWMPPAYWSDSLVAIALSGSSCEYPGETPKVTGSPVSGLA